MRNADTFTNAVFWRAWPNHAHVDDFRRKVEAEDYVAHNGGGTIRKLHGYGLIARMDAIQVVSE
jgi:hypothetical protein